jgi:ribonuclease BN (tRNA processing enzyme)
MTDVVRVTVAGSGDAFGTGGRLQTCLHVRRQGVPEALLIDCGASALIGLRRFGLEPNDVGVVAVSHLHGDHFHIDGFSVGGLLVDHPSGAPALALRAGTAGRTVAYSGDTAWTESLIEAANDADLFVCEAYTLDQPARHNLHLPDLRANAHRLNCRRLLLTHAGPQVLAADQIEFDLARDGMVLDL